ncbi:MAG TPA: 50S ribosomal protein L20 [Candidatus Paceibacterota bacterium]|nr:50S ribosomal protein L20 [Candidatus Paceibacterota bacterium]
MSRVKKGVNALKGRKNVLRKTKGFRFGRSTKERAAYDALVHAGAYAFAHRRDKKNDFRRLWTVRLNSALRPHNISYSKFIGAMKKKGFEVDRKILAALAKDNPESFSRLVAKVSA